MVEPLQAFLRLEAAGGLVLIGSALVALAWASSPFAASYEAIFHTSIPLNIAERGVNWTVRDVTNDGPMTLFFVVAGCEIKRELSVGELIALFYGAELRPLTLFGAAVVSLALFGIGRARVQSLWPYVGLGLLLWALSLRSGIHATLAGVVIGLAMPASSPAEPRAAPGPLDRTMRGLHGLVAFGVVPLFALANAGVVLGAEAFTGSAVVLGVMLGLLVGKPVGVLGAVFIATRLGLARLPDRSSFAQLLGAALIAGIGFTMSLFIGNLGLGFDRALEDQAKLGVLAGSTLSAVLGLLVLRLQRPLGPALSSGR